MVPVVNRLMVPVVNRLMVPVVNGLMVPVVNGLMLPVVNGLMVSMANVNLFCCSRQSYSICKPSLTALCQLPQEVWFSHHLPQPCEGTCMSALLPLIPITLSHHHALFPCVVESGEESSWVPSHHGAGVSHQLPEPVPSSRPSPAVHTQGHGSHSQEVIYSSFSSSSFPLFLSISSFPSSSSTTTVFTYSGTRIWYVCWRKWLSRPFIRQGSSTAGLSCTATSSTPTQSEWTCYMQCHLAGHLICWSPDLLVTWPTSHLTC